MGLSRQGARRGRPTSERVGHQVASHRAADARREDENGQPSDGLRREAEQRTGIQTSDNRTTQKESEI